MSARRSFLKGAGIVGAFAVGVASYRQVKEVAEANRDISHLAPENQNTFILQGQLKKQRPQEFGSFGSTYYIQPVSTEYENKVSLAVGKDNRLWLKVNDEWKRVSIEG